jgi:PRC-barrel domain
MIFNGRGGEAMLRHSVAAAAIMAALLSPALAQSSKQEPAESPAPEQSKAQQPSQQPQFLQQQSTDEWRSSSLIGTGVVAAGDQEVGEIKDVLINRKGTVKAVILGIGGFLGVGEKVIAIPFDALTIGGDADGEVQNISVGLTREELKQAPAFRFLIDGKTTTGSNTR